MVDINHLPDVKVEDEVVLIGQQGEENITVEELAQKVGTINYEIITRINPLIPRIYI
jgi:alanine racemase